MLDLNELNSNLLTKINIITLEEFKKLHKKAAKGSVDNFVANIIEKIEYTGNGYKIYDVDGKTLELRYDGSFSKNGRKFSKQIKTDISTSTFEITAIRPRIVSEYFNSSRTFEYWIGLCSAYLANELPETFDCKLEVNVMDHSGNLVTAEKLGIPFDIHEYNLEWCLHDENKSMGKSFKKISKIVGGVYRLSAMDYKLKQLYQLKKYDDLKKHITSNYEKVTDYCAG